MRMGANFEPIDSWENVLLVGYQDRQPIVKFQDGTMKVLYSEEDFI